jgi:hypothetical protein
MQQSVMSAFWNFRGRAELKSMKMLLEEYM